MGWQLVDGDPFAEDEFDFEDLTKKQAEPKLRPAPSLAEAETIGNQAYGPFSAFAIGENLERGTPQRFPTELRAWTPEERARLEAQKPAIGKVDKGGERPGFFGVLGESGRRGAVEGLTSVAEAPTAFRDRVLADMPKDEIAQLLAQPASEGWSNPRWWAAHIAHGTAASSPSLAAGAFGAAAGGAVGGPAGALAAGAGGFGIGSLVQSLAPSYQRARAEGLDHDAAVDRAITESGISGVTGAVMGLAPALRLFGTTAEGALKRPISEALAQIFGVQPGIGMAGTVASRAATGQALPTADELATQYATQVGTGAVLTGMQTGARAAPRWWEAARDRWLRGRESAIPVTPLTRAESLPAERFGPGEIDFGDLIPDRTRLAAPSKRIDYDPSEPAPQAGAESPPPASPLPGEQPPVSPGLAPEVLPASRAAATVPEITVEAAPVPPAIRANVIAETLRQMQAMPQVSGLVRAEQQRTGENMQQLLERLVGQGPLADQFAQTANEVALTGKASRSAQPLAKAIGEELAKSADVRATEAPAQPQAQPAGQRGVDVLQFIRANGGLKPSRELSALDARRYPGLINRNGLDADKMRERMVEAGYLQEAGPDQPATTTPADVYDLLSRSISGERIVPAADQAGDEAFAANRVARDARRELQAAERTFVRPEIARYDAEIGGDGQLWKAYQELSPDDKNDVIDRNRRGADIVDLLEEKTLQNPLYYALGAPIKRAKVARDELGFYSKAVESAKALKQETGTPQQMLAQLESAGVKNNEIEATGLDRMLLGVPLAMQRRALLKSRNEIAALKSELADKANPPAPKRVAEINATLATAEPALIKAIGDLADAMRSMPKRTVSKAEIQQYLDENRVALKENKYGGKVANPKLRTLSQYSNDDNTVDVEIEDRDSGLQFIVNVDDDAGNVFVQGPGGVIIPVKARQNNQNLEDAERAITDWLQARGLPSDVAGEAEYRDWSLDPSNPTYRENIIHLGKGALTPKLTPAQLKAREKAQKPFLEPMNAAFAEQNDYSRSYEERQEASARYLNLQDEMWKAMLKAAPDPTEVKDFIEGHWDERNVVVHNRTAMFTDTKGRNVFNIDEVQSTWGQRIRDGGTRDEEKIAELEARTKELDEQRLALLPVGHELVQHYAGEIKSDPEYPSATANFLDRYSSDKDSIGTGADRVRMLAALNELSTNRRDEGLPAIPEVDALFNRSAALTREYDLRKAELSSLASAMSGHPLVSTTDQWVTTAMRRLIQQAADSGADGISITPGKVQNERYNLEKHVSSIDVMPLSWDGKPARQVVVNAPSGVVASGHFAPDGELFKGYDAFGGQEGKSLGDLIGKELADRILAASGVERFSGEGLKVGGDGMRATYDRIYPRILGKLLQKLDPSIKQGKTRLQSTVAKRGSTQTDEQHDYVYSGTNFAGEFVFFPLTEKAKEKLADEAQPMFALGAGRSRKYPMAPRDRWYAEGTYEAVGGRMVEMTPDEYLAQTRPMAMDELTRENVDDLKRHIREGGELDPLALFSDGREDGRHRAIAAKELGIKLVPVINYRKGDANVKGRKRTGDRAGRDESGSLAPLKGAPVVAGATGPDPKIVAAAEDYARSIGIDLKRQAVFAEIDEALATRIAQAYEEMSHNPRDPQVRAAYDDMIVQTINQYRALERAGYKFFFYDEQTDPYAGNPWNSIRDLRENQRMGVFATEAGFGSGATDLDTSDSPMLVDTGIQWPYGSLEGPQKRVLANDLFRAVHDAFGHSIEGAGFRARGEENAWQAHIRLYTGLAQGAVTTETRGQNSWLNFGPYGEANRNASVEDTVFADQKIGLMPEWTWQEGRAPDQVAVDFAIGAAKQTQTPAFKRWFGDSKVVDDNGDPLPVYHATLNDFAAFSRRKANPESDMGAGFYFTDTTEDAANNYAHEGGPDISNRIHLVADQLLGDDDFLAEVDEANKGLTPHDEGWVNERDRAYEVAKATLMDHEGVTVPVYLKMENPVQLGDNGGDGKETFFDYDLPYNEEVDDYGEESGKLADFIQAFRDAADEFDVNPNDVDGIISGLLDEARDYDGLPARQLIESAKRDERLFNVSDDDGRLVGSEIVRRALEKMGFDGIIDRSVSEKFGPASGRLGGGMEGMNYDTTHYIAFKPNQIKSAIGNRGTFDPNDDRIAYATAGKSATELKQHIGGFTKIGRAVDVPHADAVLKQAEAYAASVPTCMKVAALARIEPVKGKKGQVKAIFKTQSGDLVTGFEGPWEEVACMRAFYSPGQAGKERGVFLIRFAAPGDSSARLAGEVRHESIHALRRSGALPAAVWSRLLGHAKKLRLLESDLRTYLQAIGDPDYRDVEPGLTIIREYMNGYKGLSDIEERVDQEYVAHMAELYSHGQLLPQEIGEVADDLDAIFAGAYSAERNAAPITLAGRGMSPAFAGPWAKTAKETPLILAKKLAEIGRDKEDVWKKTGWFQGADGKWRFEIDDKLARIKISPARLMEVSKAGAETNIGALLDHPDLLDAYPELRSMHLYLDPETEFTTGGHRGRTAPHDDDLKHQRFIVLGMRGFDSTPYSRQLLLSTLLHEIQHEIQDIENFATGGSPAKFRDDFLERLGSGRLSEMDRRIVSSSEIAPTYKNWLMSVRGAAKEPDNSELRELTMFMLGRLTDMVAFEHYKRLAGEVEAREVQHRLPLGEESRKAIWPMPVPAEEQNVQFPWADDRYSDVSLSVNDPAFRRWFGNSKVVDSDGKPLVVYHGTEKAGFDRFDPNEQNKSSNTGVTGFYFTNHKFGAQTYSGTQREAIPSSDPDFDPRYDGEPGNYPVYLSMQEPLVVDFQGNGWDEAPDDSGFGGDTINDIANYAEASGFYDGVIAKNISDEGPHGHGYNWGDSTYIVFDPKKIKSATQNRGTFDPNDDRISYALAGKRAIGAPAGAFKTAEGMEARGRDPEAIWQSTGVARGIEGKQRWEIDDSGAKIIGLDKAFETPKKTGFLSRLLGRAPAPKPGIKEANNVPLLNVLHHPKLYNAYPFLRQMRVDLAYGDEAIQEGSLRSRMKEGKRIYKPIEASASTPKELLEVLMHEIQHYIQDREGFARGADFTSAPPTKFGEKSNALYDPGKDLSEEERQDWRNLARDKTLLKMTRPETLAFELITAFERLDNLDPGTRDYDYEQEYIKRLGERLEESMLVKDSEDYVSSFGEHEARAVERRLGMTPEQRREASPFAGMPEKLRDTSSQTRDYQKAYDEVMRRAQVFKQIKERWKERKDLGNGVSVVRPNEEYLVYTHGQDEGLIEAKLFSAVASAEVSFWPEFFERSYADQKKIMDVAMRDLKGRNVRPAIGGEPSDDAIAFWSRYDPRQVAFDPRFYAKEIEAMAREQYGDDVKLEFYSDGTVVATTPEMEQKYQAYRKRKTDSYKAYEDFLAKMVDKYGSVADMFQKGDPKETQKYSDLARNGDDFGPRGDEKPYAYIDLGPIFGDRNYRAGSPQGVDRDLWHEMLIDEQLNAMDKMPRPGDEFDFSDLVPAQ